MNAAQRAALAKVLGGKTERAKAQPESRALKAHPRVATHIRWATEARAHDKLTAIALPQSLKPKSLPA